MILYKQVIQIRRSINITNHVKISYISISYLISSLWIYFVSWIMIIALHLQMSDQTKTGVKLPCLVWSCSIMSRFDRVSNRLCDLVRDDVFSALQPLSIQTQCYRYFHSKCSDALNSLVQPVQIFSCYFHGVESSTFTPTVHLQGHSNQTAFFLPENCQYIEQTPAMILP